MEKVDRASVLHFSPVSRSLEPRISNESPPEARVPPNSLVPTPLKLNEQVGSPGPRLPIDLTSLQEFINGAPNSEQTRVVIRTLISAENESKSSSAGFSQLCEIRDSLEALSDENRSDDFRQLDAVRAKARTYLAGRSVRRKLTYPELPKNLVVSREGVEHQKVLVPPKAKSAERVQSPAKSESSGIEASIAASIAEAQLRDAKSQVQAFIDGRLGKSDVTPYMWRVIEGSPHKSPERRSAVEHFIRQVEKIETKHPSQPQDDPELGEHLVEVSRVFANGYFAELLKEDPPISQDPPISPTRLDSPPMKRVSDAKEKPQKRDDAALNLQDAATKLFYVAKNKSGGRVGVLEAASLMKQLRSLHAGKERHQLLNRLSFKYLNKFEKNFQASGLSPGQSPNGKVHVLDGGATRMRYRGGVLSTAALSVSLCEELEVLSALPARAGSQPSDLGEQVDGAIEQLRAAFDDRQELAAAIESVSSLAKTYHELATEVGGNKIAAHFKSKANRLKALVTRQLPAGWRQSKSRHSLIQEITAEILRLPESVAAKFVEKQAEQRCQEARRLVRASLGPAETALQKIYAVKNKSDLKMAIVVLEQLEMRCDVAAKEIAGPVAIESNDEAREYLKLSEEIRKALPNLQKYRPSRWDSSELQRRKEAMLKTAVQEVFEAVDNFTESMVKSAAEGMPDGYRKLVAQGHASTLKRECIARFAVENAYGLEMCNRFLTFHSEADFNELYVRFIRRGGEESVNIPDSLQNELTLLFKEFSIQGAREAVAQVAGHLWQMVATSEISPTAAEMDRALEKPSPPPA